MLLLVPMVGGKKGSAHSAADSLFRLDKQWKFKGGEGGFY